MGLLIGIDPGKKGGICFLDRERKIKYVAMPEASIIHELFKDLEDCFCVIEKAQAMSKPGVKQGITSMFNYGVGYGILIGILTANRIPYTEVAPRKWQSEMIPKAKKGGSKIEALRVAKQLYPSEKFLASDRCRVPHDGIVDAILLAEYARRKF